MRSARPVPALLAAAALSAGALGAAASPAGAQSNGCPAGTVDLGTYCVSESLQTTAGGAAEADWFAASRACSSQGGRLPTADELIGAADRLRLASRLDDNPARALLETDAGRGLRDLREMTSTLITTRSGSSAGGSLGTSEQAQGDPAKGEPDPVPEPSDTAPSSLQYLTVVDNGDKGGFAGAVPVGEPSRFRCAFAKLPSGGSQAGPAPARSGGESTSPSSSSPASSVRAAGRVSLSGLQRSGVIATVGCRTACAYTVALRVPNRAARRLGLTTDRREPATLARSGARPLQLDAGSSARHRLRPRRGAIANMRYWARRLRASTVTAQVVLLVQEDGSPLRTRTTPVEVRVK